MAIGLDQVKKKTKSKKPAARRAEVSPSTRPQLRPWSQRGLAKEGRSTKERSGSDHHISDEWMGFADTHESPLFWVDLSSDSQMALIQEKLVELESRATKMAQKPKAFFNRLKRRVGLR